MPKALAVVKKDSEGGPDIGTGWRRWVYIGDIGGDHMLIVIVGSGAQLTTIDANPNCAFGMQVTSDGTTRFPELDQAVPAGFRTRANTWLTARGLPTIPNGTTFLQVVRRVKAGWDYGDADCSDT